MNINIVAVGKLKEKYWTDAIQEYAKRISRYANFNIITTPEVVDNGVADTQNHIEGVGIIKKLKNFVIALDIKGTAVSSEKLASTLKSNMMHGVSEFTFVIGGSRGLSKEVIDKADMVVSFGKVTYPHQLMRVILTEQIYRAITIINNIKYHK